MMGCCKKSKAEILIDKVKSIARGWSNVIWPDPETEKIAYDRIKVCAECPENVKNFCKDCGCWIPAKARSLDEHCKKWNK